jgi:hypothetical protein
VVVDLDEPSDSLTVTAQRPAPVAARQS